MGQFSSMKLAAREGWVLSNGRRTSWQNLLDAGMDLAGGDGFVKTLPRADVGFSVLTVLVAGALSGRAATIQPLPSGSMTLYWFDNDAGGLTIFTSGSTGEPKPVHWDWDALFNASAGSIPNKASLWCGYPMDSFAGLQVAIAALKGARVLHLGDSLPDALLGAASIDLAMAPPTRWRRMAAFEDLRRCARRVGTISMGGEPADQGLLDVLGARMTGTRIVHVYATTELGSVFTVADGLEGFPTSFLARPLASGARLHIKSDELVVTNAGAERRTGDLVEVMGDRVLFRGRRDHTIMVAGRTVSPAKIETALRIVAGVADIKVYGVPSSVTGTVLVADVVIHPDAEPEHIEAELRARARAIFRPEETPRRFHIVSVLATTHTGKAALTGCQPIADPAR